MVISPLFFNYVILPSLFSNEAVVCPCSVITFGLVGLNGKKEKNT
jgi:hypothetical protein